VKDVQGNDMGRLVRQDRVPIAVKQRIPRGVQSLCGANAMECSKRLGDATPTNPVGNDT
jgi:hypothetical protein